MGWLESVPYTLAELSSPSFSIIVPLEKSTKRVIIDRERKRKREKNNNKIRGIGRGMGKYLSIMSH
jgi:hypothetical protein